MPGEDRGLLAHTEEIFLFLLPTALLFNTRARLVVYCGQPKIPIAGKVRPQTGVGLWWRRKRGGNVVGGSRNTVNVDGGKWAVGTVIS